MMRAPVRTWSRGGVGACVLVAHVCCARLFCIGPGPGERVRAESPPQLRSSEGENWSGDPQAIRTRTLKNTMSPVWREDVAMLGLEYDEVRGARATHA